MFYMVRNTAQIFKALGDETRLRIMALLLEGKELCVCDIMAALQLPQSTVSRHLSCLRHAGLVEDRRQGIWMYYQVNRGEAGNVSELPAMLAGMLTGTGLIEEDKRRLAEHLEKKSREVC
jgi:ArsR family transcriptional regulator